MLVYGLSEYGTYTRTLRAILNISRKKHSTKQRLYGKIPAISSHQRNTHPMSRTLLGEQARTRQRNLALVNSSWTLSHQLYIYQLRDDSGHLPENVPKQCKTETDGDKKQMEIKRYGYPTRPDDDLTRFNKIAIQGTPQMAVDKEARAYRESTHMVILF